MAYGRIKTNMGNDNGKGRWMPRADAKKASKKLRRREGRDAAQE